MDYVFRIKAKAVFEDGNPVYIFDFFILTDSKFDEFFLFQNVWKETLLMHKMYKDWLQQVAIA